MIRNKGVEIDNSITLSFYEELLQNSHGQKVNVHCKALKNRN